MKYVDIGMVYIPIDKDATKEEMERLRAQHPNKTVIFLRSGNENMKKVLLNFIVPR
jgi:hypothetical protein